jgi:hypothetical protein
MADKQNLGRATQSLNFSLEKGITPQSIEAILQKVYLAAGCRSCGLVGFDIRFHVIDPESRAQFQGIENLVDVSTAIEARV